MNKAHIKKLLNKLKDPYNDGYITRNNIRYYLRENPDILFECVKNGDKLFYNDGAIILVFGYSDNADRKYVKLLANDFVYPDDLLYQVCLEVKDELWAKIKVKNPLKFVFEDNGFVFVAGRGAELLLIRKVK